MNNTSLKERIAYYMFVEGIKNTTESNWTFYFTEISEEFHIPTEQVEEMFKDVSAVLLSYPEVLDVWGPEETGEGVFDITFSSIYTENWYDEDEELEITEETWHYEVEEWESEYGEIVSSNSFIDFRDAKRCYDEDYSDAKYKRLICVREAPWGIVVMETNW